MPVRSSLCIVSEKTTATIRFGRPSAKLEVINKTSLNILAMKMKIPNGSGNGYYGHDNGIISYVDNAIDTEADVQGTGDSDFSEYLWMENEEEFDKQVLQQLEEEELMEECLEAMLEEERQHERNINSTAWSTATSIPDNNAAELCQQLSSLRMQDDLAKQSTLNPDAAEFIPAIKSASVSTSSEVTAESSSKSSLSLPSPV